jgi:hypothetical protein
MKIPIIAALLACIALFTPAVRAADEPVDFNQARQYLERRQRGEALTAEEDAYLRRAMAERQRQQDPASPGAAGIDLEKARAIFQRQQAGERVSAEDEAYLRRAKAARAGGGGGQRPPAPPPWTQPLTPLTELGPRMYKGEAGGLYGGGRNEPPESHRAAAMREAAKIRPLDAAGNASADGRIGFLSVGMSNTTQEFSRFMQIAHLDQAKSRRVVLIDGAQGGQTGLRWADPQSPLWQRVDERLTAAGLSARQVQAAWMKQAEAGPAQYGDFPKHARQLQASLVQSLANLKRKFPNLRLVYLSSRIYAGYATTALNPEPYAYEEAFTMRWLIQDQIAGNPELNYDPTRGTVQSPLLLWGPYLWADGLTPRQADGLTYSRADFSSSDGTHPTDSGRQKVAELLLKFLRTDPTAQPWFTGQSGGDRSR